MTRRALKVALGFVALWGVGRLVSRRLSHGDANSDTFALASICGGASRRSTAASLIRGEVLACMGGVDLDLTAATLDPSGAELQLLAIMGGVQVTVADAWRVEVEHDAKGGGVEVRLPDDGELPADAPTLRVAVRAVAGGVLVAAAPSTAA